MKRLRWIVWIVPFVGLATLTPAASPEPVYVKKATRVETIVASLKASGLPALDGSWHIIGPFDGGDDQGFDTAYPPEMEIDLQKTYAGKDGRKIAWKEFVGFKVGEVNNLKRFKDNDHACVYLLHEFESPEAVTLPVSLGSDDSLAVWLNGERLLSQNVVRSAAPDQDRATLKVKAGKNRLLVKVGNVAGEWAVYIAPELPVDWPPQITKQLNRDFPPTASQPGSQANSAEAAHYRIVTLPVPPDVVLE